MYLLVTKQSYVILQPTVNGMMFVCKANSYQHAMSIIRGDMMLPKLPSLF